jgi:hypothetical protein
MNNSDTNQSLLDQELDDGGRLAHLLEDPREKPEVTSLEDTETVIEPYVIAFNTFGKVASSHIILQRRTVAQAKAKLDFKGFEHFCCQVGLDPKSSKCRKYQRIGAEADWLLPIADALPPDWTTIYNVARLGQIKVKELMRLGKLHPETTAKELKTATNANALNDVPEEMGDEAAEACVYRVDASDLPDSEKLQVYIDLQDAVAQRGLTIAGLPQHLAEQLVIKREAA